MLKQIIKRAFYHAGFRIEKRDLLEATIPADYPRSPFLPLVYRENLYRIMYFRDTLEKIKDVDGDIVECGVSIGHGALFFLLIGDCLDVKRVYYGFDSFEGFPPPCKKDESVPITGRDYYVSPPETVLRVLRDGGVSEDQIRNQVRLVRGWFRETLPSYKGEIALLHLDCDLYESYNLSLETLYERVASGGIILFDEYCDKSWPGSTKAIDDFFLDKPEKVQAHEKCKWKYYVHKV